MTGYPSLIPAADVLLRKSSQEAVNVVDREIQVGQAALMHIRVGKRDSEK